MTTFFFNFNVGSGIEKIGNTILKMLPDDVVEYKLQNPPCIIIDALAKSHPDVIIMNEFYPRTVHAAYYYKRLFPDTKVILINHALSFLRSLPLDIESEMSLEHKHIDRDSRVLINYAFRNVINTIININCYPYDMGLPDWLESRTCHRLFPVDESEFQITTPFSERVNDFFYFGNVLPHKLSAEFITAFSKTDMQLDIYGKMFPVHEKYNQLILDAPNITYHGFLPAERVKEVMNSYRFFISARDGHEPFMTTMAEVIMSGAIPLVANDRTKKHANWIDHYRDCYLEFQSVPELLNSMRFYLGKKNEPSFIATLEDRARKNSEEMTSRTSCVEFKKVLRNVISS